MRVLSVMIPLSPDLELTRSCMSSPAVDRSDYECETSFLSRTGLCSRRRYRSFHLSLQSPSNVLAQRRRYSS